MGTAADDVDIPVDIRYSHGSWSIMSMLNPSNVINICESTSASVSIDFSYNECQDYFLWGILHITPEGNTDIFTLYNICQEIAIEGNYSTGESFDVIGCSDNLNDIFVDIIFDGDEYHSASYSLTSYALAVTNLTDGVSMFTGLEDADNDGTNNVNDLDNAGSFMPFLVKTHESATNAFFRFDFDETKIKLWVKDGTMQRTDTYLENNGDVLQDLHAYSYNDLFLLDSETNIYVQALEPGEHSIDVTYVLDGDDLWTENMSATFVTIDMTAYRPQTEGVGYGNPFQKHEVPDDQAENSGAGIRVNGDTETGANENDLIEVELQVEPYPAPAGLTYVLRRNNSNIKVWDSRSMGNAILQLQHRYLHFLFQKFL